MRDTAYTELCQFLVKMRYRWRTYTALIGLLIFLSVFCSLLLIAVVTDQIVYFNTPLRFLGLTLVILAFCSVFPLIVYPLIRPFRLERIARRLEIYNPDLENRLINCLLLTNNETIDMSIVHRLADAALNKLKSVPRSLGFRRKHVQRLVCLAAGVSVLLIGYAFVFPEKTYNSLARIFFPWADIQPLYETRILVTPGDVRIPEGDALPITIQFEGIIPPDIKIKATANGQDWIEEVVGVPEHSRELNYRFDAVVNSFDYTIQAGDGRTPIYHVEVLPRPVIVDRSITYHYPFYTELPTERKSETDGGISALVGTKIILSATSDLPLSRGLINLRSGENTKIVKPRQIGTRCIEAELVIEKDGWYTIKLFTEDDVDNRNPVRHPITAIPDMPPQISFPLPGRDLPEVSIPARIPCLVKAADDFGLKTIQLLCRDMGSDQVHEIDTKQGGRRFDSLELDSVLDVTSAVYQPGQTLELYAMAVDSLGQKSKSQKYTVKLVAQKTEEEDTRLAASELTDLIEEMREPLKEHPTEDEEREKEKEKILETLDEILKEQKELIPPTKDLLEVADEQKIIEQEDELERLAQAENRILEELKDFNQYLKELAPQKFDDPSLVDEWNEIFENVERAEESLIGEAVEIALKSEEAAVWSIEQLEERIESELESWLPEKPDRTKWNLEDAPEEVIDEISMVDLPEELEDLIGDLIEDEEDVTEETEDLSSNWASADLEEGWDVMDGQISNYSAKGKTGNTLPDSTEAGGRSGEGRTGKSNGEFVEKFAQHKDDRQTPARMRDEEFEDAVVQELDNKPPSQSTGGGKKSGMGPEGFTGKPPLMLQEKLNRLNQKQSDIRDQAEKLDRMLNALYLAPKELSDSIRAMKEIEEELAQASFQKVLEKQRSVIDNLKAIERAVTDPMKSHVERAEKKEKDFQPVAAVQEDRFPEDYAEAINLYFRSIAER